MRLTARCPLTLAVLCVALVATVGAAQQPAQDAEAAARPGAIRGVVVAASGAPMARAQVRVNRIGLPGEIVRATGADGAFAFDGLAPGRYRVRVAKPGYVPQVFGEGADGAAGAVEVVAGSTAGNLRIALRRGGVITGRITDRNGEPLSDVMVSALRYDYVDGVRRARSGPRAARTNDIGEYRLFGLLPGEYYVLAGVPVEGDVSGDTGAAPAAAMRNARTAVAGVWSAAAAVAASARAPSTYFPGVLQLAQAQPLSVGPDQTTAGVDFVLSEVSASHIAGTVEAPAGAAAMGGAVRLRSALSSAADDVTTSLRQGAFRFDGIAPGTYVVEVHQRRMSKDGGRVTLHIGKATVTIAEGQNVDDLEIGVLPGATVRGRIVWEGREHASARPLVTAVTGTGLPREPSASVAAAADGRFELEGVDEGVLFRTGGLPSGWSLKQVRLNGRSITDTPATFPAATDVDGLEIVVTDRMGGVEGAVEGLPGGAGASLVVFAADKEKWTPRSRFVTLVRTDAAGEFSVKGLPDGDYVVALTSGLREGQETAPQSLEETLRRGTRVRVREGGNTRVVVRSAQ